MRKIVRERRLDIDLHDMFAGKTLDDVRTTLNALAYQLERETVYYGHPPRFAVEPYGYDGGFDLYLDVYRDESDHEYAMRMADEEKARQKKEQARLKRQETAQAILKEAAKGILMANEAAERAEYERLKAKFESGWKAGDVDRQSGAFTQDEIDNSTAWR